MDAGNRARDRALDLEFPGIADALTHLQARPLVARPPLIREDGRLPDHVAREVVAGAVTYPDSPVYALLADDARPSGAQQCRPFAPRGPEPASPTAQDPALDATDESIFGSLPVHDVAREALRARFMAFGEARTPRTVYENVFLMLAFAVMVLLVSPPLVDVLLAAHGVRH